ncbi:RDD family protein [Kitasatospora sp. GAS204B]|uniref:RDD family protein n=1 Tax=unclassified Kitasatospora TaxID=2633591 RepID=UPI0024747C91|nr:RDD family protein [Kitasatospora sp. GAS204B]MDH6117774.1 putative RDD family membrane protein YckC [Kitasatospora sp. GAS204B]
MADLEESTVSSALAYTHWSVRVVSFVIDMLACWSPNIIAGAIDSHNGALQVGMLAVSVALLGYNRCHLAGRTGQSWGKRLMGTDLVGLDTQEPIGARRAFLRDLAHLLDTLSCFLGWLWPLWDDRKQTFADKLAATAVLGGD